MHRTQKIANDPTASVGISENAAACKQNIAKNTPRPPILSERAGHRSRPTASATEMIIMKAAPRAAEAPPIEPAITLERVMNLGENRIEMRILRSAWFPRDLCFPYS